MMSAQRSRTAFTIASSILAIFTLCGVVNCQSKSAQNKAKSNVPAGPSPESAPPPNVVPGAQALTARDLDGKAYSLDGKSTTAIAIINNGESRRPVFIDNQSIAFSSRRASLERWQVFEANLSKKVERRISFDAGDAEPVTAFGPRLVIASSSDERKSSARVLNSYQEVFNTSSETGKAEGTSPALQHLLLEHPASGRKGTEWLRMSSETAQRWIISRDRDGKLALAVLISKDESEVYRFAMTTKAREPEARGWVPVKVEIPATAQNAPAATRVSEKRWDGPLDGRLTPDGDRIVWSNGSILWTTTIKGGDATRIGDDSLPAASDLALDPSGQWIVFSSPSSSRGMNLLAVHRSGRCLKTLTELPGDETEPVFSPDGQTLAFSVKQGDSQVVAKIPFLTSGTTVACN